MNQGNPTNISKADLSSAHVEQMRREPDIFWRVSNDQYNRARAGIVIYPFAWLFMAYVSELYVTSQALVVFGTVYFLLTSALRLACDRMSKKSVERARSLEPIHFVFTIAQAGGMGGMLAYSLFIENSTFFLLMIVSIAGLTAGGSNSFAPSKRFSRIYSISLIIPFITCSFWLQTYQAFSVLLIVNLLYMYRLSGQQSAEYWYSLSNELTLARLSQTDELTQLNNRRYFSERLENACRLADRSQNPISVLFIDVDHFKSINDEFGHSGGDEVLIELARRFKAAMPRKTDLIARLGGEEFAALLPITALEGAEILAERIRLQIEQTPFSIGDQQKTVTVSIGIATSIVEAKQCSSPDKLLKAADHALYQAKADGRNRVVKAPLITPDIC